MAPSSGRYDYSSNVHRYYMNEVTSLLFKANKNLATLCMMMPDFYLFILHII